MLWPSKELAHCWFVAGAFKKERFQTMKLSAYGWLDDNGESKPSRFDWGLLPPRGDFGTIGLKT